MYAVAIQNDLIIGESSEDRDEIVKRVDHLNFTTVNSGGSRYYVLEVKP